MLVISSTTYVYSYDSIYKTYNCVSFKIEKEVYILYIYILSYTRVHLVNNESKSKVVLLFDLYI